MATSPQSGSNLSGDDSGPSDKKRKLSSVDKEYESGNRDFDDYNIALQKLARATDEVSTHTNKILVENTELKKQIKEVKGLEGALDRKITELKARVNGKEVKIELWGGLQKR